MAKKRAVDGLITEVTEKIMEMMVELGLENVGDEVPAPEEDPTFVDMMKFDPTKWNVKFVILSCIFFHICR